MGKKVYGLISDSGDGYGGVKWYDNLDRVNKLLEKKQFHMNCGYPSVVLDVPDGLTLESLGIELTEDWEDL